MRLSGSRIRNADDVLSLQRHRDHLLLDRGKGMKSLQFHQPLHPLAELIDFHWHRLLFKRIHYT